ncbi:MAG: sigma-70 family RNA polymerase sigma factor [Acidobacteria bacterium]|nr:sigma-70 family RNA polymerase sigma factor [Acidobacteriota bacterium]MCA1642062.1 sigma-70 family RNA polymerase sigma factor [Acidobacteriota bacterium]
MRDDILTSETELIALARAGDREAFCRLASLHAGRVHALALHFCRDASDAEDLSQEVWLRAFRSLDTFRAESSFYTWLRRIAVNTFLNERRAARSRCEDAARGLEDGDAEATERAPDAESALHERLLAGRVRDALSELSPQQRLVFLLKHDEGMTCEEIAQALSCSAGTVKKSLARAVAKLRARLCAETGAGDAAKEAANFTQLSAREGY